MAHQIGHADGQAIRSLFVTRRGEETAVGRQGRVALAGA
jgi:hypothetical protein